MLWYFPGFYEKNNNYRFIAGTSIRVGTSATVTSNAVCKSGINNQGMFICNSPLTGTNLGLVRESTSSLFYWWSEIRAYEFSPLAITINMLSTDTMPNSSLINSLSFSMTSVA